MQLSNWTLEYVTVQITRRISHKATVPERCDSSCRCTLTANIAISGKRLVDWSQSEPFSGSSKLSSEYVKHDEARD